jgi:hypothetical protein
MLVVGDIVYDEQTICETFHSLDLKQLEYLYDVLSMIIDKRVIDGDHISHLNVENE